MTIILARCQNCTRLLPKTRHHHIDGSIMYLCRECHDIFDFIAKKRTKIFRPQHDIHLREIIQQRKKEKIWLHIAGKSVANGDCK
jgi:ribosome-binding protein aMBF1 (putative translation factor)